MMRALRQQIVNSVRLNLRNRMAMIYGYAFPLIFLLAFWTIYRSDRVPLLFHMGELLTVTVLGGACFGMPTTMVSERERGVWRRYRISPAPAWVFIGSVLFTRYLLVLTAALLQIGLAVAIGMTAPRHPLQLLFAFTVAAVAFMGIGLQIAMLADSVPAVQALGQCIFLPMLMIGGVAVPLSSLPHWAVVLSAFFPGRYSVHAMQSAVTGDGLSGLAFDVPALALIGIAGAVAALATFRWNPSAIRSTGRHKGWLALALLVWVGVGVAAQRAGRIPSRSIEASTTAAPIDREGAAVPPRPTMQRPMQPETPGEDTDVQTPAAFQSGSALAAVARWQDVTDKQLHDIAFDRLPPDDGLVSPIAHSGEESDVEEVTQLEVVRSQLAIWAAGKASDPVQRARNELYVAAVPDLLEIAPIERFVPLLVFSRLHRDIPADDLPKILYWIATHPGDGDDSAIDDIGRFGFPVPTGRKRAVRSRVAVYAMKLLGRQTGAIVPR